MKRIYDILFIAASALSVMACQPKIDKDLEWPEWASRPLVENLTIQAADGSRTVEAGGKVKLTADIHDDYTDLSGYILEVKYGDHVVSTIEGALSGNTSSLDEEFVMPFAAGLESGGYLPEISLKAFNVKNGFQIKRIPKEDNVTVTRPELPSQLYMIDDSGHVIALIAEKGSLVYKPSDDADFTVLGSTFHIAEKVSGSQPDFSGIVWGNVDGELSVVSESSPFKTPDSGGYGFKRLNFDTYSFQLDKLVNLTIVLDKEEMLLEENNGVTYYCLKDQDLVKDCEFEFKGFGKLSNMLQADRFEILTETTARFTGHSSNWSIYYDSADNWLIVNYSTNNLPGQFWVTGVSACFPLGNDDTVNEFKYLAGDGKVRYATLSAIREDDGDYNCLVYLKKDFVLQFYAYMKWSTVVSMVSATPELCIVSDDGIYLGPGSNFKPGVYMVRIHVTKDIDSSGNGCKADISLVPYQNE